MLHYNVSIFIDNRGEEGLAYAKSRQMSVVVAKQLTVEAYTHQITLACTRRLPHSYCGRLTGDLRVPVEVARRLLQKVQKYVNTA